MTYQRKFEGVHKKTEFWFVPEKCHLYEHVFCFYKQVCFLPQAHIYAYNILIVCLYICKRNLSFLLINITRSALDESNTKIFWKVSRLDLACCLQYVRPSHLNRLWSKLQSFINRPFKMCVRSKPSLFDQSTPLVGVNKLILRVSIPNHPFCTDI